MPSPLHFDIRHRDPASAARLGRVTTPHGSFDTPAFMPVGTQGALKGLLPSQVHSIGAQIVLGNTYHLMLRPGSELVAKMGGLHAWMRWPHPILTDSGGFQVFSLGDINRISDDGVVFKSHLDGALIDLTPERSMRVQNELGADIIMAFDDCPPAARNDERAAQAQGLARHALPSTLYAPRLKQACERTIRWLERCVNAHAASGRADEQALFPIVQGGTDLAMRAWSAERTTQFDSPGYAIGGVAVGEGYDELKRVVENTAPLLPADRPRYLMGVGYERDILAAVRAGVDMFDCVLPTRNGRNANAFTSTGQIRLRNAKYKDDPRPIEDGCDCPACAGCIAAEGPSASSLAPRPLGPSAPVSSGPFSRSYLRHLFVAEEMLGPILVSLHNLRHFQRYLLDIRQSILHNDWSGLVRRWPVAVTPPGA